MMDAHQTLAAPIQIDRCRAVQIEIANFDNVAGPISLAVLLEDGTARRARALYLGQKVIFSTLPGHFSVKSRPAFETLEFSLPAQADLRRFDEITLLVLPDIEHSLIAPRIAIEQFRLFPR